MLFGQGEISPSTSRCGLAQRGAMYVDEEGIVRRWNGKTLTEQIEIALQPRPSTIKFAVYENMGYSGKPDFYALYNIKRTNLLGGQLWTGQPDRDASPLQSTITALATTAAAMREDTLHVIDIEHWPFDDPVEGPSYIAMLNQLYLWMYAVKPTLQVGIYSMAPKRDYFRATKQAPGFDAWQAENDRVEGLVTNAKVILPSLYAFYPEQDGWVAYAKRNIAEARRYRGDKPVIAYIWPRYHDSNPTLGLQFLLADYWLRILETCKAYTDGIVIWDGANTPWSEQENAPWWIATKEFLKTIY